MELINIKLNLTPTFESIPPVITLKVNEQEYYKDVVVESPITLDITHHCNFKEKYNVQLLRQGKNNSCPEQLLIITGLEIDGTNIRDIMWHNSVFHPEYPEPWASEQKQKGIELEYPVYGETILGHNGTWEFEFSSPFYQFLINKVKGQ